MGRKLFGASKPIIASREHGGTIAGLHRFSFRTIRYPPNGITLNLIGSHSFAADFGGIRAVFSLVTRPDLNAIYDDRSAALQRNRAIDQAAILGASRFADDIAYVGVWRNLYVNHFERNLPRLHHLPPLAPPPAAAKCADTRSRRIRWRNLMSPVTGEVITARRVCAPTLIRAGAGNGGRTIRLSPKLIGTMPQGFHPVGNSSATLVWAAPSAPQPGRRSGGS
jgi:hypothetical protein